MTATVVALLTGPDLAVNTPPYRQADAVSWLLFAVSAGALPVRSRWPVAVAVVTGAANAGWALYGHIGELLNLPVMAALYAVAVRGERRRTVRTAVVAALASGTVSVIAGIDVVQPQGAPLLEMLWPLVPLLLGEAVRARRELAAQYAARAAHAEAEREREARRRVEQERLRIARELHDVVAHTVSAMTVQAGLALDAFDTKPEVSREAMRQVRRSGKEAVRELRATVGVLRHGAADAVTAPAPRLAELPGLAARVRATGLRVTLDGDTGGRPLPQLVELAAYRIVQEALTNVIKHAGARCVAVSLTVGRAGDRLEVEVTDDGPPGRAGAHGDTSLPGSGFEPGFGPGSEPGFGSGPGEGFGLIGMRERAAAVGGTVEAGPVPGGGWRVYARLPVDRLSGDEGAAV